MHSSPVANFPGRSLSRNSCTWVPRQIFLCSIPSADSSKSSFGARDFRQKDIGGEVVPSRGKVGQREFERSVQRFGHILMERRKRRNSRLVPGDGLAGMAEEEAVANEGDVWWITSGGKGMDVDRGCPGYNWRVMPVQVAPGDGNGKPPPPAAALLVDSTIARNLLVASSSPSPSAKGEVEVAALPKNWVHTPGELERTLPPCGNTSNRSYCRAGRRGTPVGGGTGSWRCHTSSRTTPGTLAEHRLRLHVHDHLLAAVVEEHIIVLRRETEVGARV
nr:hypothetical protein Iba_chr06bCG9220 [Ipomoea batatas]